MSVDMEFVTEELMYIGIYRYGVCWRRKVIDR